MTDAPPVALSIAGSDCSAGAGIQADLKTFQYFHVHGLTAITCVVSETAQVVRCVHFVPVAMVCDQLTLLLEAFPVVALKTGMLVSAALDHKPAAAEPIIADVRVTREVGARRWRHHRAEKLVHGGVQRAVRR